jgi:HEAT repeat protein
MRARFPRRTALLTNWQILNVALLCGALLVSGGDRAVGQVELQVDRMETSGLIELLNSANPNDRLTATQEIKRRGENTKKLIPRQIHWLLSEPDPFRSGRGLPDVIRMGELAKITTPHLIKLLNDPEISVRNSAIAALDQMALSENALDEIMPEILARLNLESDPTVRFSAIKLSASLGEPEIVISKLYTLLEQEDRLYPWMRPYIIGALVELGEIELINPMLQQLKDSKPEIRSKTAQELGDIGLFAKTLVKPNLIALLQDPIPYVQISAAEALKQIGEPEVTIPYLLPLLKHSLPFVRRNAVFALNGANWPAKQAIPNLQMLLQDPEPSVRQIATDSLKRFETR